MEECKREKYEREEGERKEMIILKT